MINHRNVCWNDHMNPNGSLECTTAKTNCHKARRIPAAVKRSADIMKTKETNHG